MRVATFRVLRGNSYKALITIAQVEIDRVVCGFVATGVSRSKYLVVLPQLKIAKLVHKQVPSLI